MQKRKSLSPPLKIVALTGDPCSVCFGTGVYSGALYEMVCGECGGLGIEQVQEPYAHSLEDALARQLIASRRELIELKRINRELSDQRIGSRFD